MIFHEIYSAYYNVVAGILSRLLSGNVSPEDIGRIIREQAFSESAMAIEAAIREERWQLFHKDGSTALRYAPSMPLTTIQKAWLKAVSLDPRIRLFDLPLEGLEDVEPLFTPEDYYVFDKYGDGDPFEDASYIHTFRLILDAIKNRYPLCLGVENKNAVHRHSREEHLCCGDTAHTYRFSPIPGAPLPHIPSASYGWWIHQKPWEQKTLPDILHP